MYYRDLLTTQTSEGAATGQARPFSVAGPLGVRPLEAARAAIERDRPVLLAEHDPEAKEDPIPPMASRRSLGGLLGQATELKRHEVEAGDVLRSGVVCEVYVIEPRHPSSERSLCSRGPHDRCDRLARDPNRHTRLPVPVARECRIDRAAALLHRRCFCGRRPCTVELGGVIVQLLKE
jgi:hypothetical protein